MRVEALGPRCDVVRALAALLVAALVGALLSGLMGAGAALAKGPSGAGGPPGAVGPRVAISEGVSVAIPPGFSREVQEIDGRADLLQLTDGSDVLVIVVYRKNADRPAPTAAEALDAHTSELAQALGQTRAITTERLGLPIFAKRQPTKRMLTAPSGGTATARQAWVVAGEHATQTKSKSKSSDAARRTVVCSALTVLGSPNASLFEAVVASVASR